MEPCGKVEKPWNEAVKAIANKQMLKKASTEDEKIMENNTDDGPTNMMITTEGCCWRFIVSMNI